MSINEYILEYADAEVARLRALNTKLVNALLDVVKAKTLEAAQAMSCAAIAIAIVEE